MNGTDNLPAVVKTALTEQRVDLSKVNLMLPTQTFGEVLGLYDRITIEVVTVDPNPDNGDVYEISKGKKTLGKRPLEAISNAVGVIWDPHTTTIIESTSKKSRAKATGAMRKPNGEMIVISDEKTVDLEAIEEEQRIKTEDDSQRGKIVEVNGKIQWEKTQDGKPYPKREPFKDERERLSWIEREVRKAMVSYRKFKDERAMTGAKERVIRGFLALKNSYTAQELAKPFAFPRVVPNVDKMLADPQVRQAALDRMSGAVSSIFGPGNGGSHAVRDVSPARAAIAQDAGLEIPAEDVQEAPVDDFQDDIPWDESPEDIARRGLRNFLAIEKLHPDAKQLIEAMLANKDASLEAMNNLIERTNAWLDKAKIARPVGAAKGGTA